jgi:ribosome maturation factor RimP
MDASLERLIEEVRSRVAALGFELADLQQRGAGSRIRLQVRIDRPDARPGHGVTIEDCTVVSRALEAWLDATQMLGPRYVLEVSSPGIERPLRWREHWERFRGQAVNVRLRGKGRRRATIVDVPDDRDAVVLAFVEGASEEVPLEQVQDATLAIDWDAVEREARHDRDNDRETETSKESR